MMQLTIVGFGNQAKAWSMNLKDSNYPLRIALRVQSNSIDRVKYSGLDHVVIGSPDFYKSNFLALLIPDEEHASFLEEHAAFFPLNTTILYAHGFSALKNEFYKKFPQFNHILYAPKCIGVELRNQYLKKGKLGAVYSFEHLAVDKIPFFENWIAHFSKSLGINIGPFKSSFRNETYADLFSEQAILCSLIPFVAELIFKNMTQNGISSELAYLETWHELKLIMNAMIDTGPEQFFNLISPNALLGAKKGKQLLINDSLEKSLDLLFKDIENNTFFKEIESMNLNEIREEFRNFWQNSSLNETHNKIMNG